MSNDPIIWKVTARDKESGDSVVFLVTAPIDSTEEHVLSEALKTVGMFTDKERVVWLRET